MNFEELLKFAVDQGASDVHFQSGSSPQLRLGGLIRNVESPAIAAAALRKFIEGIAPPAIATDLDGAVFRGARFSKSLEGLGRFRCSLYSQRGQPGLVMHQVPATIPSLEELNLPASLREITQIRRGITIVTGPSGSGKSATLAALVDQINENFYGKIVTIEDPIEVLYPRKKALVAQREIGTDVASTADGIEQAIAQDADVIVAGEIRDAATVRTALRGGDRTSGVRDHVQSERDPGSGAAHRHGSHRGEAAGHRPACRGRGGDHRAEAGRDEGRQEASRWSRSFAAASTPPGASWKTAGPT